MVTQNSTDLYKRGGKKTFTNLTGSEIVTLYLLREHRMFLFPCCCQNIRQKYKDAFQNNMFLFTPLN